MKYRKKPIVIEAEQWFSGKQIKGVHERITPNGAPYYYWIPTLEGEMTISDGDWVITGVEGEKYPCKDSIFKKTYELVEE